MPILLSAVWEAQRSFDWLNDDCCIEGVDGRGEVLLIDDLNTRKGEYSHGCVPFGKSRNNRLGSL